MTAVVLDGKSLAAKIREEIASDVVKFKNNNGWLPGIAVVKVGADPASERYVKQIGKSFQSVGMSFHLVSLPDETSETTLVARINELNAIIDISGIIVQLPLPAHIRPEVIATAISPTKDVDGVNPLNMGKLMMDAGNFLAPATPAGGMLMLERYGISLEGKKAIVIGRSAIVGKPMAMLLLHKNATVTIAHSKTKDLPTETRNADILVAAVGKAHLVTADMVKPGATVIDFGINIVKRKVVGDVDYDSVKDVAGAITPVPGGTGPMTNIVLMHNTLKAACATASAALTSGELSKV